MFHDGLLKILGLRVAGTVRDMDIAAARTAASMQAAWYGTMTSMRATFPATTFGAARESVSPRMSLGRTCKMHRQAL
jgi:hypothetical protein